MSSERNHSVANTLVSTSHEDSKQFDDKHQPNDVENGGTMVDRKSQSWLWRVYVRRESYDTIVELNSQLDNRLDPSYTHQCHSVLSSRDV